ncbi:MAG: hypothetical protein MUF71_20820 [Candidatus Kapabacteria bacterium]|nr:hypothetical protein [Candidatus Kapabacteria bacterium]
MQIRSGMTVFVDVSGLKGYNTIASVRKYGSQTTTNITAKYRSPRKHASSNFGCYAEK